MLQCKSFIRLSEMVNKRKNVIWRKRIVFHSDRIPYLLSLIHQSLSVPGWFPKVCCVEHIPLNSASFKAGTRFLHFALFFWAKNLDYLLSIFRILPHLWARVPENLMRIIVRKVHNTIGRWYPNQSRHWKLEETDSKVKVPLVFKSGWICAS